MTCRALATLLLSAAVLASGCQGLDRAKELLVPDAHLRPTGSTPARPSLDDTVTIYSIKGPIVLHYRDLVVPDESAPVQVVDPGLVEREVRAAFGSLLASVSAVATSAGEDVGACCWARYTLVGCPVVASTILIEDTEDGFIPPYTQYSRTPLGCDRMSTVRFRALLRAYGVVSHKTFGSLDTYRSAASGGGFPLGPNVTTITVSGHTRRVADVWVVSPGATTVVRYRKIASEGSPPQYAYVFYFPQGADPEYLGRVKGVGGLPFM